ncbi:MAG: HAD-IA family hydrolase [Lachnospiraceae bacterium]|nr:HAD-IA family hydrolase [Lachnospiraceae bacterium]
MIDTVIFDLDGTLLNTLDDLMDSVNYALGKFGLLPRSRQEVRAFLGNGAEVLMNKSIDGRLDASSTEKCIETFKHYYKEHMDIKTKPYEGVLELIRELLKKGYHMAIVSNKFDAAVKGLNVDYFEGLFPVAIGESSKVARKPAPDTVVKALNELGSSTDRAIYVGDSEVDIMTAKNSGLPCVSVTWGFRDEALLSNLGTDYIIDTPMQLIEVIERRNNQC